MRQIRKIGCLCIFVVMIMLAFGCSESPSPTATGSEMTTSTYPSDPIVPTDTVKPGPTLAISDTEGRLLSYHGTPAPVFAYNQEHGELLAYCFEEGSSHLPYVLGGDGEREDPACSLYIPDYDRTVSVLFDSESGVWRVFSESLDSLKVVDSEWIVYNDRAYIADRAADLKREVSEGAKPRYYSVESGLYYFFTDGGLTLAIDMNGDGATEMVNVFATQSKKSKTMDCSVRLNGEEGLVIKGVLSFSVRMLPILMRATDCGRSFSSMKIPAENRHHSSFVMTETASDPGYFSGASTARETGKFIIGRTT